MTAVVCMKLRFEAKVTRGFSLSPHRFRDTLSPLRGLLLISFAKKNQEKPLGPGYTNLCPSSGGSLNWKTQHFLDITRPYNLLISENISKILKRKALKTISKTQKLIFYIMQYTGINIYLNSWTKFLLNSRQPSKARNINRQSYYPINTLNLQWKQVPLGRVKGVRKSWFPLPGNFSVRTHVKFTCVNEVESGVEAESFESWYSWFLQEFRFVIHEDFWSSPFDLMIFSGAT